ncbi:MAG: hypothetical protein IIZ39_10330 [Blautia sp.]|nr:hypothetical protein [Blautia sp.]
MLFQGEGTSREVPYGDLIIENGDYVLRVDGKVFSGYAFLRTDFYHEKGGAYYYLDVYAVDGLGFEISLPQGVLADVRWGGDLYYLEPFLKEQGHGQEMSYFVVYPGADGKVSVYSTFYDEESHSLKFVADRLGPAVLVAYENKDNTPLMESEDFLKAISDAALSFPAEVDWRNKMDANLQLGEMHVTDGDYYLYGMAGTYLDETESDGVTAHDMPGEGLYFTTALTKEEWDSIKFGEMGFEAILYSVPFSYYEDMEKTFGENYREKRYFALFPSSEGMVYYEAVLNEEMKGFYFQSQHTGDFFLVAVEDEGVDYIIDSDAFIKTLQETFSLYRENLSNGEPLDKPLNTIAFHRTWINLYVQPLSKEALEERKGRDVDIQEGVAWDAGAAYHSLRAKDPEGDSFDALRITYSPEEGKLNERFGEGWEERYTYAVFTDGDSTFNFYPVTVLKDGRIRFTTDKYSDFVLVNLSKPLEDLPGMGTTDRSRKIWGEYPELEKLLSWLRSLPGYREGSMEVIGGDFPLGILSNTPSGEADIVDMPVLTFDELDVPNLSVEGLEDTLGDIPEIQFDLLSAPEPWSEATTTTVFHPLPGAYGYYTLKGEGFPKRVRVLLEEKDDFASFWGHGWEERPIYALFVGKSLDVASLPELEEEMQTLIEEGLKAFPCEYDPFAGELSFEPDREGDFFFVSMQEGETAGEALFEKWARKLMEQIRRQISEL